MAINKEYWHFFVLCNFYKAIDWEGDWICLLKIENVEASLYVFLSPDIFDRSVTPRWTRISLAVILGFKKRDWNQSVSGPERSNLSDLFVLWQAICLTWDKPFVWLETNHWSYLRHALCLTRDKQFFWHWNKPLVLPETSNLIDMRHINRLIWDKHLTDLRQAIWLTWDKQFVYSGYRPQTRFC